MAEQSDLRGTEKKYTNDTDEIDELRLQVTDLSVAFMTKLQLIQHPTLQANAQI